MAKCIIVEAMNNSYQGLIIAIYAMDVQRFYIEIVTKKVYPNRHEYSFPR